MRKMRKLLTIVFLLFIIKFTLNSTSAIENYEKFGVIPYILQQIPNEVLEVIYENDTKVALGNELTPSQTKNYPKVKWNGDSDAYYTLLMIDPDAPNRYTPVLSQVEHWLVVNIPGTQINKGETYYEYFGPGPPKASGLHRYIFLVFQQPKRQDFSNVPKVPAFSRKYRFKFSTKDFADLYSLGEPIAANFFQAQWDKYVEERNKLIVKMEHEPTKPMDSFIEINKTV